MKRREILERERLEEMRQIREERIDSRGGTFGSLEPRKYKHYKSTLTFTKKPRKQVAVLEATAEP